MRFRVMACIAAALLAGAVPAAAQQGGGSATRAVERLAERSPVRDVLRDAAPLGLTAEQVRALEAMDRELAARTGAAVAAMRSAEAQADRGAAGEAGPGERMRTARTAIMDAQREAAQRVRALLTPEQRERLGRLAAERAEASRASSRN